MADFKDRWFSAGMLVLRDMVLVLDYYPDFPRSTRVDVKFPGGGESQSDGRNDQNPVDTLMAEMREEVLQPGGMVTDQELLYTVELPGHSKHFFGFTASGKLRVKSIDEQEDNGRVERLGPPRFMDVRELAKVLFPGHLPGLKALCEHFASSRPAFRQAIETVEKRLQTRRRH